MSMRPTRPFHGAWLVAFTVVVLGLALAGCSRDDGVETITTASGAPITQATTGEVGGQSAGTTVVSGQPDGSTVGGTTPPTVPEPSPMPPAEFGGPVPPSPEYVDKLPELEEEVGEDSADLSKLQELAIAYYQTQQFDKAEATYRRMLAVENTAAVHNNLGNVYRDWGRFDLAVEEYGTAVELEPTHANAWVNLATLYSARGDSKMAKETARKGLEHVTGSERERLERLME